MKEYNTLVSIIVPVYGTEEYLPACIDSICKQTYSNLQIILVDDGSPDKCPEICDEYAKNDLRITVIHQENKGVSCARNTGLRHAEGEYLMFVDSDDELMPNAVEILLEESEEHGADIVSGAYVLVKDNDDVFTLDLSGKSIVYAGDEPLILSLNGEANTESACAKLFRAELIRDIRFTEGKKIHEDGFFIFQCYVKKPLLVHIDVAVYRYNMREGSASKQRFSEKYLSMLYFLELKKQIIFEKYPQYVNFLYNSEVRTNLQLLDVLCGSSDKTYTDLQKCCIRTVKNLRKYHVPINKHHKMLEKIVVFGLYPIYKLAVRLKYYR